MAVYKSGMKGRCVRYDAKRIADHQATLPQESEH